MVATVAALALAAPPAALPRGRGFRVGAARVAAPGCPRCVQTESWASTVRYRDPPNQLPPHRTMAALPRDGLIVHVTRAWEPHAPAWMRTRRPLRIVRAAIHASFEGNTTRGRVSLWAASTWRAGSYVTVWVLFGTPAPTAAAVARAQRELDTTRFPRWSLR